jgi:hypothetical protein
MYNICVNRSLVIHNRSKHQTHRFSCNYVIKLRTHTKKKEGKMASLMLLPQLLKKTSTVGKSGRRMRNYKIASSRMHKDKSLCR